MKIDPKVRDILKLLGLGTLLTTSILMPGTAVLIKTYTERKIENDKLEWERFNLWRLRYIIKRLEKQKIVEIDNNIIRITDKGRKKLLKFDLEKIELKRKTDGKWRLIIYDISNMKRENRDIFRLMLHKLKLFKLQESVYLTPFICEDEIEYLRQMFNIGNEVMVLKVTEIENEQAYKSYFGI